MSSIARRYGLVSGKDTAVKKSVDTPSVKLDNPPAASVSVQAKKESLKITMAGKRKPLSVRLDEAVLDLLKRNSPDHATAVSEAILLYASEQGWQ